MKRPGFSGSSSGGLMDHTRWKVVYRLLGLAYWLTVNQLLAFLVFAFTVVLLIVELGLEFVFDRENILNASEYPPVWWEWEHDNLMYVLRGTGEFRLLPPMQP